MTRKIVSRSQITLTVLGFMMAHADAEGIANVSISDVSKGLRMNYSNAGKHVKRLMLHGDIKRIGDAQYMCVPITASTT